MSDSLRNVFSKYGLINRIFVEERQKYAYGLFLSFNVCCKCGDRNMGGAKLLCFGIVFAIFRSAFITYASTEEAEAALKEVSILIVSTRIFGSLG